LQDLSLKLDSVHELHCFLGVGLAQLIEHLGYWLNDWGIGVQFSTGVTDFSFLHSIHIVFGAYSAS
jgi:hypothetical protein